jgi:hypothetical protein
MFAQSLKLLGYVYKKTLESLKFSLEAPKVGPNFGRSKENFGALKVWIHRRLSTAASLFPTQTPPPAAMRIHPMIVASFLIISAAVTAIYSPPLGC